MKGALLGKHAQAHLNLFRNALLLPVLPGQEAAATIVACLPTSKAYKGAELRAMRQIYSHGNAAMTRKRPSGERLTNEGGRQEHTGAGRWGNLQAAKRARTR